MLHIFVVLTILKHLNTQNEMLVFTLKSWLRQSLFTYPKRPNRLRALPSLLLNGNQVLRRRV